MVNIPDFMMLILYMQMNNVFLDTLKKYNMVKEGDTVAVCVSGGADSMALFHLFVMNKQLLNINLLVLHVNHGLRKESDSEEIFVKDYCEKNSVKCIALKADMLKGDKPKGLSIETWAREIRYRFFKEVAKEHSAILATAHTLSDSCETVLFNITRGGALKGATGIPPKRENIIRPLINVIRKDIERYCVLNSVPYVIDNTNFQDIYSRNRIRLNVIPQLKLINPKLEKAIMDFSTEAGEIYTFLTQLSDNLYRNSVSIEGFKISVIKKENPAIIKNFLRNILEKYNCLSKDNILIIYQGIEEEKLSIQLSKDIICEVNKGYLSFYKPTIAKEKIDFQKKAVIIGEKQEIFNKMYTVSNISKENFEIIKKNDKNYLTYCIDCDRIREVLFFRTRKLGDRFSFINRNITKSVKKLLIEDKIEKSVRDSLIILSDENDSLVWLEGYGVTKQYCITQETKNILIIKKE